MQRQYCYSLALLVLGSVLVAGCGSTRPRSREAGQPLEASAPNGKNAPAKESALDRRATAHAHYAAGVIHELNNEAEQALQEFYLAALDDPTDETLILGLSGRFLREKQPEKAVELLRPAAARRGASGEIFARLGLAYAQLGKADLAAEADRAAIKKLPGSFLGYENLFLNYLQQQKPEEALAVLDEAAKVREADAEFLLDLAELYASYGVRFPSQRETSLTKARAVLGRVGKLKLPTLELRLRLADTLYLVNDNERAAQLYLELLKQVGNLPPLRDHVRANLTDIYLTRAPDRKRAVEQLEAILRDDPSNAQAYYFLATIAYDEKRMTNAVEFMKKTLLFSPNFEEAYYDLANFQLAANQADDALATLQQAQRKFPRNYVVELMMGLAFSVQKNFTEAINHFTAAEIIAQAGAPGSPKPDLAELYFHFGSAFERKGDIAQAEKYFEQCLGLSPNFPDALNYLGYMWADRGVNLDKAREMIEKAVKLKPNEAAFLDSLGWVLFKQNQPKEALDYILKAVELSPEPDATLYDHLGDIYAVLQDTEKAREAWRKSLSVEANEQVRKKLEAPKAD